MGSLIRCKVKLDLGNCGGGIKTFWACSGAVKDCMTTVETHLVLKFLLTVSLVGVTRISNPTVSLHESSWAKVLVLVPPIGGTGGRTAGTKDAFIEAIEFLAVLLGLEELAVGWGIVILKVGLDGLVLLVEQSEVGDEVLHDVHVGKGVNLCVLTLIAVDATEARESILAVNIHCAGTTNTLSTRATKSECRIYLILDFDERIENHRTALIEVDDV